MIRWLLSLFRRRDARPQLPEAVLAQWHTFDAHQRAAFERLYRTQAVPDGYLFRPGPWLRLRRRSR